MSRTAIYTIGYSNHEPPRFLELLRQHGITAVADVRSSPYSRRTWYCSEPLAKLLHGAGIAYVYLGEQLGARRSEPEAYVDDRVSYEHVAELPAFVAGLERVERGAAQYRIALMCGEAEPLECHRGILIARALVRRGNQVWHIHADGHLEDHLAAERRLIKLVGCDPLFDSGLACGDLVERAYRERGRELAFRRSNAEGGDESSG